MNTPWTPEEIKRFERKFKVKCTLRPDGMYDVKGDINISDRGLKDLSCLPPIHTLSGFFTCHQNSLVSLEGAPVHVGGNFWCTHNSLVSLKGAPVHVGGFFSCHKNSLASLDGAPVSVGGDFWCTHNPNLLFTQPQLNAITIEGEIHIDPWQLIPEDPSEFIERELLPI